MNKEKEERKKITPELQKLILARMEIMPPNFKLSIGDKGTFNKSQLMEHIQKGDDIGLQIIDMQMSFIRALTSGKLIETINESNE